MYSIFEIIIGLILLRLVKEISTVGLNAREVSVTSTLI